MQKCFIVLVITALAALSAEAVDPATPTVEERITSLSLEVKALQKDNDLLTGTLKENWVAFSSQCGNILASESCSDVAKDAEKEVEKIDQMKQKWMHEQHHGKGKEGKHHKGNGGRHGKGKHGKGCERHKPEMPSWVKANFCVLKEAYMTDAKIPVSAHCKKSAQRFELFNNVKRPPPRFPHHRGHGGPLHHMMFLVLIGALLSCCGFKCVSCIKRRSKQQKERVAIQELGSTNAVVYMGQPVIVSTPSAPTEKV